ncbi:MAG: TonB-dependent receptor [Bacteroidota bacterium]
MKKLSTLVLLCCCMISSMYAQSEPSIVGTVVDAKEEPLSYANVILHLASDSSIVKLELTDDEGRYRFSQVPKSAYFVRVSYVGLPEFSTSTFEWTAFRDYEVATVFLEPASNELSEVTVVAKRPILEAKPDKLVFNVEGSINASGSDALELLRKAPGVVVDNNDNVSLMGKSSVRIYIDGKPSVLSASDLAAYLKTIPSDQIDNIEIITNPSAKYEAEGSAGIINIKLKKDKRFGSNANVNLGYSVGRRQQYNGSVSSNYRNKRINLFGNYSYYTGESENYFNLYREQVGLVFDQQSLSYGGWDSHNLKAGADFSIDDRQTLGVIVDANVSDNDWFSDSDTKIGMVGQNSIDSLLIAASESVSERSNVNFNLNYRFDNQKGKTWNIDADYGRFRKDATDFQPNTYLDATGTEVLNQRDYRFKTPTDIDILTFKVDHERPFAKGQLSTGAKFSYVNTDNTFDFYEVLNNDDRLDPRRSNNFTYLENVNAVYANYSRQLKKWGFQGGLRLEQTNSDGELTSQVQIDNDRVNLNYLDLFPSAGITYQLNPKNSFQLTYSRRINRPSYQDLNPFESKLDELTFEKGNPFLQPEYTHKVQLTHTFNYSINTSLEFSHTRDLITRITDTASVTETFITWLNLADQYDLSLNVSGAIPIKPWWSTYTNITGFRRHNKANYGEGKVVDIKAYSVNLYHQQTFQLPWELGLELSGWYSSPTIWGGTFETGHQYSIDAGLQKKLMDGRATLRISVSDIFKTTDWEGVSRFGALFLDTNGGWDSRRFRVNFSYMFGNNQVKSRRRKTGLQEESQRIKSDNG